MAPVIWNSEEETVVGAPVPIPKVHDETASRALLLVLSGPAMGCTYTIGPHSAKIGRGEGSEVLIPDPVISRQHARIARSDDGFVIRDLGSSNGTFVDAVRIEAPVPLRDGSRIQLGPLTIIKFSLLDSLEAEVHQRLHEAIHCDVLTGVRNRRYLETRLLEEFVHAVRHQRPLSLMMVDIDHFKSMNDTHGHQSGDVVLRTLAAELVEQARAEDVVVRYGGEEFLILARELASEQALQFAERLRGHVQSKPVLLPDGQQVAITVSIGVAALRPGLDREPAAIIGRADAAMYRAKLRGRNCVDHGCA
jgi:diguanylate cyclase (GGDEF)-like protein